MQKLASIMAAAILAIGILLCAGCGSFEDDYYVYEVSKYKDIGISQYDVVYYDTRRNYSGEILTGFVEELHFDKTSWTESQIKESLREIYPGIDEMPFVQSTLTDEGDYYCSIVEFDDLDVLDNLTVLYQHETLFDSSLHDSSTEAETLVSAVSFKLSLGGTLIQEDDIDRLGLHYFASKES